MTVLVKELIFSRRQHVSGHLHRQFLLDLQCLRLSSTEVNWCTASLSVNLVEFDERLAMFVGFELVEIESFRLVFFGDGRLFEVWECMSCLVTFGLGQCSKPFGIRRLIDVGCRVFRLNMSILFAAGFKVRQSIREVQWFAYAHWWL